MHIGLNLPPKDNLRKEDTSSAPKVSFIQRFHCKCIGEIYGWLNTEEPDSFVDSAIGFCV